MNRYLIGLTALLLAFHADAQQGVTPYPYQANPMGTVTSSSFSVATGLPIPSGQPSTFLSSVTCALVVVEGNPVRWSDTVTPTASVGMLMAVGQSAVFCERPSGVSKGLPSLQFIPTTGSVTIDVAYYN